MHSTCSKNSGDEETPDGIGGASDQATAFGVAELYGAVGERTKLSSQETKWGARVWFLCMAILGLFMVVFEIAAEPNRKLTTLLSKSTLLGGALSGALIRFPTEARARRAALGSILSQQFLRETNLNTTSIDLRHGEVRPFRPIGHGTHFFLHLSTYRSTPRAFSTVGDIERNIVDWMRTEFNCTWVDGNGTSVWAKRVQTERTASHHHGVYDPMVIICHFESDVGVDSAGGELWITYSIDMVSRNTDSKMEYDRFRTPEKFLAFKEPPGYYNASAFEPPFQYDIVFCGSPVFGNVTAQRIREWLAHTTYVLGDRAHLILYDGGGFHPDVMKVIQPWVDLGRVTVENVRLLQMYEAYYRHQDTVLNDCLFKSQYMANWTIFFDVNEYLMVNPMHNLTNFLADMAARGVTTVEFNQKYLSTSLCATQEGVDNATRDADNAKRWASEKLVFAMLWGVSNGNLPAQKYAVQGRYIWATEVHSSESVKQGERRRMLFKDGLWFYHFHGFVVEHGELCRDFTDPARATLDAPFKYDNNNYTADFTLANLASEVKKHEFLHVGDLPFIT